MADKEYIEVKKVLSILNDLVNDCPDKEEFYNRVFEEVDAMPAADVVEVRRGEWTDKPTGAYGRMQSWCSACGKHSGIGGIESNRHKPYCPNCGAKMDGDRKEQI